MLAGAMSPPTVHDAAVQRELMRMALRNSARSVPLQLVAVAVVVWFGLTVNKPLAAMFVGLMGSFVGLWRWRITHRYGRTDGLDEAAMARAAHALEGNAVLAGLMWMLGTFAIYPLLHPTLGTVYVAIICGSVAAAAVFMSLVGRSFAVLTLLQLGSLMLVCLLSGPARSYTLAVLTLVFGVTMYRAAREFRDTATLAIRHGLEAEAAHASVRQAKEAAEAANLAKSQFLATMSHEIRTPMNGVLGALDLLRRSPLDESQRRLVRSAASSGESLLTILNDVLDHSKIEAGQLQLAHAPLSLDALAQSVVGLFRANAQGKGLTLSLDVDPALRGWVLGDAQRLKQVLLNLVGNAIKFTDRGDVLLSLRCIPAENGRVGVVFEVRDTGIGLSDEAVTHLFQPFHQIDSGPSRRNGGTGLGLAISQRIVRAMGGAITVHSQPGKGSRFSFELAFDRHLAPVPAEPDDSALAALDELQQLEGRALVVEDNPVNLMVARQMLESLGLDVVEAVDGAEALEQLEAHPVDVVLMDCQMPVMDGYTATRYIREREGRLGLPRLPVLALTANAFEEDTRQALAAGMDDYLAKPYTRRQLRELLLRWL